MIPGLWDMHVHTVTVAGRELLGLYVANGVTGVRDMASDWPTITAWRREHRRGHARRAAHHRRRTVSRGRRRADRAHPHAHARRRPRRRRFAHQARRRLRESARPAHAGDVFRDRATRAREGNSVRGTRVARSSDRRAASDSGQRSIEHLLAIPAPCTPAESIALAPRYPVQGALGRCSSENLADLYARFVRNNTWVTPTFTAQYEVAVWPTHAVPGDSLAHYLPKALRDYVAKIFPMPDSIPPGADSVGRAMFAKRLAQVAAHAVAPAWACSPERTRRCATVRPGSVCTRSSRCSCAAACRRSTRFASATYEPARYFEHARFAGTIEPGHSPISCCSTRIRWPTFANTRRIAAWWRMAGGSMQRARGCLRHSGTDTAIRRTADSTVSLRASPVTRCRTRSCRLYRSTRAERLHRRGDGVTFASAFGAAFFALRSATS